MAHARRSIPPPFPLRQAGFTLLELMMGTFVMSVSLLAMVGLVAASFGLTRAATELTQAKNGARRKLEEVRELARTHFSEVLTTYASDSTASDFNVGRLAPRPGDPDGKAGHVTVEPSLVSADLLDVTVRVDWQGAAGPRMIEMRSRVTGN